MDAATKAEAEAKLSTLYVGIGYPETWHDYSNFEVKADDIFGNIWRGNLSEYQRQIARLGKSVDKQEWSMTPQTVNAVNLPLAECAEFSGRDSAAAHSMIRKPRLPPTTARSAP
jgi:putative endopeptidase